MEIRGVLIFVLLIFTLHSVFASEIYVFPLSQTINQGDSFIIEIRGNVSYSDIYAIEYSLAFDSNLLSFNSIIEGDLLNNNGQDSTVFNYSSSSGIVSVHNSRNSTTGIYSEGIFAFISFTAVNSGTSNLNLNNVIWVNSTIFEDEAETIIPTINNGGVIINPLSGYPPEISNVQCDIGSGWVLCDTVSYGNTIQNIRATCTDSDGTINNVQFVLHNTEDNIDLIDATDTTGTGGEYSVNPNYLIQDSGDMTLTVTCTDNDANPDDDITNWLIDWGSLNANWVSPNIDTNISQNEFTDFTSSVTCTGGE